MSSKIATMVGFAIRSRNCVLGTDNVLASGKVRVVLMDHSLADNAVSKLINAAERRGITALQTSFEDELVGIKDGCKVIGITDRNMANEILKHITPNYQILFGGKHLG